VLLTLRHPHRTPRNKERPDDHASRRRTALRTAGRSRPPTRLLTGPEYGVDAASRGADRIAVSAGADLGEVFTIYDLQGNEIDEPTNPVPVGHSYNESPFYQHAALGPDGRTLAFIEDPDWDSTTEITVGDWELVVVDLDSGAETARLALGDRGTMRVTDLDFDGTWAIVSRAENTGDPRQYQPLPALAVDTTDGTVTELAGRTGMVTLVDAR